MRFSLLGFLTLFSLGAQATDRYYCNYHQGRTNYSDRLVLVIDTDSGRKLDVMPGWTLGMNFYKTYDEDHQIISVYEQTRTQRSNNYQIFKLDVSGPKVFFLYGYGYHYFSTEDFEWAYSLPFTKRNLSTINRNPELQKYLPAKSNPKHIPVTFFKRKIGCRPIGYLEYLMEFTRLLFIAIVVTGIT